jgi:hypothetical protein
VTVILPTLANRRKHRTKLIFSRHPSVAKQFDTLAA